MDFKGRKELDRRNLLKTIGSGATVAGGMVNPVAGMSEPDVEQNLTPDEREKLRKPYSDPTKAKGVLANQTASIRQYLTEEGYLDSVDEQALKAEELVLGDREPARDDFRKLNLAVVWNEVKERGEVLLETRVDRGEYRIKFTVNATEKIGSAVVYDGDQLIEQVNTTQSGDLAVSPDGTCSWTGCIQKDGNFCESCCGWLGNKNYRLYYACSTDDGVIVETHCYCWHDYSCCFDCSEDVAVSACGGCC